MTQHICMRRVCTALVFACLVLLSAVVLLGMAGCKDTNVVKNIIHDQNAEKVDTGQDKKERIVSEDGAFTDEDTGLYERGGKDVDSLSVDAVYASKDAESQLPVPRFEYDANSDNNTEASEGVRIAQQNPQEDDDEENDEDNQDSNDPDEQNKSNSDQKSDKSKKSSKGSEGKSSDGDGGKKSKGGKQKSSSGSGGDDKDPTVYDTTGKEPEIPDVSTVAAYGQIAVIVQMLGGQSDKTPLVAADDELCSSAFSRVFADEGSDQINAAGWEAESDGSYEPDVAQIIDAKPDTVLVFSDSMFSSKEKKKLAKKDISITVVPSLVSDASIMRAAETVAKMLDKETDGTSTERYEDYKAYHDSLISDIEGTRGYGAYNSVVYDANITTKPKRFNARKFTLVIDDWDYDATFSYKSTITDANAGVGLAKVGFRLSPVSYYLGVAGVVNTSAAIDTTKRSSGMLVPAWQFNPNDLKPSDINFGSSGFASALYDNWGTGFTKTTLVKPDTGKNDLSENGFGSSKFPAVIVANQKMRDAFIASAADENGIYHAYGMEDVGTGSFHGANVKGVAVFTTIDPDVNLTKALCVNPHGLFSSWIDGSAEALLESAWAANIEAFENDWSGSVETEIKTFYRDFYRYNIKNAEVQSILAGLEN